MFLWESFFIGLEIFLGEVYGKNQNYIMGDIVLVVKMLWYVIKDFYWLWEVGFFFMYQIVEYWVSWVEYDFEKDRYIINYVMLLDEYYYLVNNFFFINVVVKINLLFVKEVVEILGKKVFEVWLIIVEKIYIFFNSKYNYYFEFEGYVVNVIVKQVDVILVGFFLMY